MKIFASVVFAVLISFAAAAGAQDFMHYQSSPEAQAALNNAAIRMGVIKPLPPSGQAALLAPPTTTSTEVSSTAPAPLNYDPNDTRMVCNTVGGIQPNPAFKDPAKSPVAAAKTVGHALFDMIGVRAASGTNKTPVVNAIAGGADAGITAATKGVAQPEPRFVTVKKQTCQDAITHDNLSDAEISKRISDAQVRLAQKQTDYKIAQKMKAQASFDARPLTRAEAESYMSNPRFFPQYAGNGLWTMINPGTNRKVTGSREQLFDMLTVHNNRCLLRDINPRASAEKNCD